MLSQVYRTYIVWGHKFWVIILPALLLGLNASKFYVTVHCHKMFSLYMCSYVALVYMVYTPGLARKQYASIRELGAFKIFLCCHTRFKSSLHM